MTLGRHVSMDGTLITLLQNYGIEQRTIETLARSLPRLSATEIKGLKARLSALPQSATPAKGLVPFEEKAGLDWLIRKIKEQKDKESMLEFVTSFCGRRERYARAEAAKGDASSSRRAEAPRTACSRWRKRRGPAILGRRSCWNYRWISSRKNLRSRPRS